MIYVAEIGINHNGDVETAKQLMTACKLAGCTYVKFQKRSPDLCVPESQKNVMKDTPWGIMSYLDYKKRIEFGEIEYSIINNWSYHLQLPWFASVWDVESLRFLSTSTIFKVPFIKIPSACNTDEELITEAAQTGIPLILSTGMTTKKEFNKMMCWILQNDGRVAYVLACTSTYPTSANEINLAFIKTLRKECFSDVKIGFSNHSPGITGMLGATVMQAEMLEFHVTLDRAMWGSDHAASIEPFGVSKLIHHCNELEKMLGTGLWTVFPGEEEAKKRLRK